MPKLRLPLFLKCISIALNKNKDNQSHVISHLYVSLCSLVYDIRSLKQKKSHESPHQLRQQANLQGQRYQVKQSTFIVKSTSRRCNDLPLHAPVQFQIKVFVLIYFMYELFCVMRNARLRVSPTC